MDGNQIGFYLSTASAGTVPQPDPSASRGGYRSSTALHHTEGTLTSNMTDKDVAVDSANSTSPSEYVGAWLLFITGNLHTTAREIASFDDATGTFTFDEPFDALAASGDYYRVFVPEAVFDDLGSIVCGAGQTDYRMVFGKNNGAATLTNRWTQVTQLAGGSVGLEIAATGRDYGESLGHDYMSDVFTEPDFSTPWESNAYLGHWSLPLWQDEVYDQPPYDDNWTSAECSGLWLKRSIDPATLDDGQCVYMVTFGFDEMGGDPEPLRSSFLVVFGVDGFNAAIALEADRKPRIRGGCRVKATVTVEETGLVVEGVPVQWSLDGDGTLYIPEDIETDADGEAWVVYHSPADQAKAGNTVTIEARVI